jgi:hypothetical protein
LFTRWICPIQKSQTSELDGKKMKNSFFGEEIHGVTLHPASNVSNICVSLYDHD